MFLSDQCVFLLEALLLSRLCDASGKKSSLEAKISGVPRPYEDSKAGIFSRHLLQSLNWAYEGFSMGDCRNDQDCKTFGDHMICSQKLCACDHGFVFVDYSLVHRGCYRKAKLFDHCVSNEQCTAMNRNTYCNPSNQCTCSAGYYFDGRECILRYDTNLKAQEVYRAAVVAAACFIVAVVGIFVACIVRRTFCRREHHGQGSDSSRNSDIFSVSDEIAALRAVDKPPSYEEVLQIERTFYGIPPPEYSFVRNSTQHNQENTTISVPELENMCCQETPVDIHPVATPELLENSGSVGTSTSPSLKNCQLCANIVIPENPSSSSLPDSNETPEASPSIAPSPPRPPHSSSQSNDNPPRDAPSHSPNSVPTSSTSHITELYFPSKHGQEMIFTVHSNFTEPSACTLLPHFASLTHPNSTWPRSSMHSIPPHLASPPLTPPWPLHSHLRYPAVATAVPQNPKALVHTSSLPSSSVHPQLLSRSDCHQPALPEEVGALCNTKDNRHCVKSCSQETLVDGHSPDVSPVAYDNAAYVADPLK